MSDTEPEVPVPVPYDEDVPTVFPTVPEPLPVNTHRITTPAGFVYDFPSEPAARMFAEETGLDVLPEVIP